MRIVELFMLSDHEDAHIGMANILRDGELTPVAVYDAHKIVETLMERDGMEYVEAVDYFEFNIEQGYVGPQTPVFVWMLQDDG
jgi:hypothetical protein